MTDINDWITNHGDSLGIELKEGDIITDVILLARVQRLTDTDDALLIGATDNTGGIVQYGIVRAACLQVEQWMAGGDDE